MPVGIERRLNPFMAEPVLQELRRDVHFDQRSGVAVPEIVNPDFLHLRAITAALHFAVEEALREREHYYFEFASARFS